MYTYTAGATGLDAAMPPWVQEGGYDAWAERLKDPAIRERVDAGDAARRPTTWENLFLLRRLAESVLLVGFKNDELKPLTGKTLAEVATHARQVARGNRDGPGDRGRQPRRHGLLPDVGGERPAGRSRCRG